jgi:hypothetical protein
MSKNIFRSMILMAVVFAVSSFGFDLLAQAQKPEEQSDNAKSATQKSNTKSKRLNTSRRRTKIEANANTAAEMPSASDAANASTAPDAKTAVDATPAADVTAGQMQPDDAAKMTSKPQRGKGRRRTSTGETSAGSRTAPTRQTDLSGTYSGTFDCSDAGVAGDTTLTITGDQFNLADGKSGHITTATTRGYTAVAMQFGEFSMPTSGGSAAAAPTIVSMRARKMGDRLTLTTVPGASRKCSFLPTGTTARTRRGRHTPPPAVTNATGTETANPAQTEATSMEPATPAASPRVRRRRGRGNMKSNVKVNETPNSENTGVGKPKADASPTPTPPRR